MSQMHFDKRKCNSLLCLITAIAVTIMSVIDMIRYTVLGEKVALVTMIVIHALFILCAWSAYVGKLPALNALITVFSIILFCTTNNMASTIFNPLFLVHAILTGICAIGGTVLSILEKEAPSKKLVPFVSVALAVAIIFGGIWRGNSIVANGEKEADIHKIWEVPDVFEKDCAKQGRVEKVIYQTKAYATDQRVVEKSAYVYLPYGYNDSTQYDILYLMHGTGDDEAYWLVTHEWNKIMLDNLIEQKVIRPVIVVTPTFYVEDDCKETFASLDQLTYSFREELRNDLMPTVEGRFSTYAETVDESGFVASRTHRAFAGLSRGGVTTLHSAFCGSLDYFSRFATFSGSRTSADYFKEHVQSAEMKNYSIDYWYVTSGALDFALSGQVKDYNAILKIEDRLKSGENTSFDVFPMRYHSQGNWHLALYNFLQIIYGL